MGADADDDLARVRTLVRAQRRLPADAVGDVQPLAGGFFSRAYACRAGGQEYVVRLNRAAHAAESFAKDAYAWQHFAAPELPIPRVIASGTDGEDAWAISERVAGRTLDEHTPAVRRALLPATLDALDAIGRADVSASRGYGYWDAHGDGPFARWRDFLTAINEDQTEGYYQGWHALFRDSFLEREVFDAVYRRMLQLAEHCPEERALVHNDYQYENVMADERRVTGVIDWGNGMYGDPLYDVARLLALAARPGWWHADGPELLRARYGHLPRYDERVGCYACHAGLDDLMFYAKNGKRADYDFVRNRLLTLIAKWPHQ
jgi:hygromycin-B 4-O-kinase